MSLFGEDAFDKRDFRMGLAGLLAGIHSLRILAERGIASAQDIDVARAGITATLDQIPAGQITPEQIAQLEGLLDTIWATAALRFKGTE